MELDPALSELAKKVAEAMGVAGTPDQASFQPGFEVPLLVHSVTAKEFSCPKPK